MTFLIIYIYISVFVCVRQTISTPTSWSSTNYISPPHLFALCIVTSLFLLTVTCSFTSSVNNSCFVHKRLINIYYLLAYGFLLYFLLLNSCESLHTFFFFLISFDRVKHAYEDFSFSINKKNSSEIRLLLQRLST